MCLPRSACREHPLGEIPHSKNVVLFLSAGQVARPVMIIMLADEQSTPKLEVADTLGKKSIAGELISRSEQLDEKFSQGFTSGANHDS